MLVLDASGSMWGQVDGTPKITIARDVIQGLLNDWNAGVELGVTAYGHQEKASVPISRCWCRSAPWMAIR